MKRMLLLAVVLAACGKQGELLPKPPPGQTAAVVDPTRPTPTQRLVIPTQDEPSRVDDPLKKSEERRNDPFSLPPQR